MILLTLMSKYPKESFCFIYDARYFPYGKKNKGFLIDRVNKLISYMMPCDKIVLACNTISTIKDELKYDVIDMISITMKAILPYQRIGLIASTLTINSGVYQNKIKALNKEILEYDGTELIDSIERDDNIIEAFNKLDISNVDCLILGCTHFIYIKDLFRKKFSFPIISQDELL